MESSEAAPFVVTATELAQALGRKRQSIQRQLKPMEPSKQVVTSGNQTSAWEISALPTGLQSKLVELASSRGFGNAEQFLVAGRDPWRPRLPLRKIHKDWAQRATCFHVC